MTQADLIVIAEDEEKIAGVLQDYLRAAGYRTAIVNTGTEVVRVVKSDRPALMLLDVMLPGKSGLDICRELRAFTEIPIVFVTALAEEIDRLIGLELGADDYICKPFSPREVVARVRAVVRRHRMHAPAPGQDGQRSCGPFVLDETKMRIRLHGELLDLTTSEFKLLRKFILHPGRVFSRNQLLVELHGSDDEAFDRAIDTHIKNLRKRMGEFAGLLRSVYGVGYQLDVD